MTYAISKEQISETFKTIQSEICSDLEAFDQEGKFSSDLWARSEGGGGLTRMISGRVIEKGGVNFSAVFGSLGEDAQKALQVSGDQFYATGISIVLHPHSPMLPIIHANVRYFELDDSRWWFGGGIDLTPHYIDIQQARHFHSQLKSVCDQAHPEFYQKFKSWADDYFYLPHRKETRGVGGIFFDRLDVASGLDKPQLFEYVKNLINSFTACYKQAASPFLDKTYGEKEKKWQLERRGRYVEFNLLWDRGTKFGIRTNGRTESILMSLPVTASWDPSYTVEGGSAEQYTLDHLRKGIDWINS